MRHSDAPCEPARRRRSGAAANTQLKHSAGGVALPVVRTPALRAAALQASLQCNPSAPPLPTALT